MKQHAIHRVAAIGVALAVSLTLGACGSTTVVYVTQAPPSGPGQPATPQPPGPTPAGPGLPATPEPPGPTPAGPGVPPTPPPVPGPPTPGAPTPTPLSAGSACTGSATIQQFFADQVSHISWSIYCAVLPSGWGAILIHAEWTNGGYLTVQYQNSGGATLVLYEGNICYWMKSGCANVGTDLGSASFGDRSGEIWNTGPSAYEFWVDAGSGVVYRADGTGMSEANFRSYLAAMYKVS